MSNRISTAQMQNDLINQLNLQQAALSKTQQEVATGQAIQSPADDPLASTQISSMNAALAQLAQFSKNTTAATTRLNYSQQAFSDINNLLQSVRTQVVEANSGTLSTSASAALGTSIQQSLQQLTAIANQKDSNGEYVFSGLASLTQPFVQNAAGATNYAGDSGTRSIQVATGQKITDGFSGSQVFMDVQQGNGVFTVAPSANNTGSATVAPGTLTNPGAWQPGTYTIKFDSPTTYEIDSASSPTPLATGTYTSGTPIAFNGAQITITGTPAANDTFNITPAGTESMFTTLGNIASALTNAGTSSAAKAQLSSSLNSALGQLDNALGNVQVLNAQVGARLNAVSAADSSNQAINASLTTSVTQLGSVDYASVISQMNQQLLGLQAAQQAYVKISQLSLFQYL